MTEHKFFKNLKKNKTFDDEIKENRKDFNEGMKENRKDIREFISTPVKVGIGLGVGVAALQLLGDL